MAAFTKPAISETEAANKKLYGWWMARSLLWISGVGVLMTTAAAFVPAEALGTTYATNVALCSMVMVAYLATASLRIGRSPKLIPRPPGGSAPPLPTWLEREIEKRRPEYPVFEEARPMHAATLGVAARLAGLCLLVGLYALMGRWNSGTVSFSVLMCSFQFLAFMPLALSSDLYRMGGWFGIDLTARPGEIETHTPAGSVRYRAAEGDELTILSRTGYVYPVCLTSQRHRGVWLSLTPREVAQLYLSWHALDAAEQPDSVVK